jgi:hypothetical protein
MKVQDELGRVWLVLPGDPAWDVCGKLEKFSTPILPVETLARGVVPHPDRTHQQMHKLQTAWIATADEDVRDAFVRAVTLYDCLVSCYDKTGGT